MANKHTVNSVLLLKTPVPSDWLRYRASHRRRPLLSFSPLCGLGFAQQKPTEAWQDNAECILMSENPVHVTESDTSTSSLNSCASVWASGSASSCHAIPASFSHSGERAQRAGECAERRLRKKGRGRDGEGIGERKRREKGERERTGREREPARAIERERESERASERERVRAHERRREGGREKGRDSGRGSERARLGARARD